MPLSDVLFHIDTYPDPTSGEAITQAVAFCKAVGAPVTALAVEVDVHLRPGWLADHLAAISKLAEIEEARSRRSARIALLDFQSKAEAAGVFAATVTMKADLVRIGEVVAEQARTRDFCIVPIVDRDDGQQSIAEDVVFGSGRPTLIFQPGKTDLPVNGVNLVVLAWDGSRAAARAMADALPICVRAKEVRVLTAINEKASTRTGAGESAARHLKAHGVNATIVEVDAAGQLIGDVLEAYVARSKPDLLVMGAYGHSRLQEFILGGATDHVINNPPVALLISH